MKICRVVTGPLEENCYILIKDNECLVIDPGDNYNLIKEKIGKNKVIGILLTHNHFDHIGALDNIKDDYDCEVYSFDNLKEEEKTLNKFRFNVIYTPGHTKDSISFYFKDETVMFTGDFLFKESIGRCDLPTGDICEMKKSINKIKKYDDDIVIYPGHGESSTVKYEKDNNIYLRIKNFVV